MKNIKKLIKRSHFEIFTIAVLVGAVFTVIWFNTTINDNIESNKATSLYQSNSQPSNSGQSKPAQAIDSQTVDKLRALVPASEVSAAPNITTDSRINPFAE